MAVHCLLALSAVWVNAYGTFDTNKYTVELIVIYCGEPQNDMPHRIPNNFSTESCGP